MTKDIEIGILPDLASNIEAVKTTLSQTLGINEPDFTFKIVRRSVDARGKTPLIRLKCQVFISMPAPEELVFDPQWQRVEGKKKSLLWVPDPQAILLLYSALT